MPKPPMRLSNRLKEGAILGWLSHATGVLSDEDDDEEEEQGYVGGQDRDVRMHATGRYVL